MVTIGILMNNEHEIASMANGDRVAVYAKNDGSWYVQEEITECFQKFDAATQMRPLMAALVQEMKGCRILAAAVLTGIPYMVLDKEGFMICEADVFSEQLLEEIAYDFEKTCREKSEQQNAAADDYPAQPYETKTTGIYTIDLKRLMKAHPDMSSKKALVPFLQKGMFCQLQVICDHVMPWLGQHPVMEGYHYEAVKLEAGGYLLCIEKKVCR